MSQYYDFLKPSNILPVHMRFIKQFGIETAVYLQLVMDADSFGLAPQKITEGEDIYLCLDRKRIEELIAMSPKYQEEIDSKLVGLGIMAVSSFNNEAIKIKEDALLSCLGTEVNMKKKYNRKTKAQQQKEKAQYALEGTVNAIAATDPRLHKAYEDWLRTISAVHNRTGKTLLQDTEKRINEYSGGNIQAAIEVLEIANTFTYLDVQYAMKKRDERLESKNRTTAGHIYKNNEVGKYNKTVASNEPVEVEEVPFY